LTRRLAASGIAAAAAALACGEAAPPAPAGAPGAPNVVFIVIDTARADRMSYAGCPRATTPRLDAFARDAVDHRGAHAVAPWTLPSHMSMFTGLLPGQHGATWAAFASPADASLEEVLERALEPAAPERLLPRRLRELGYTTLGFSANAWVARRTGFAEGFDVFHEVWREGGRRERLRRRALALLAGVRWLPERWRRAAQQRAGDAGQLLDRFQGELEQPLRAPWFLFFNVIDPHFPYAPPEPWRQAWSDDAALAADLASFRLDEMALVAGARPLAIERLRPFYDAEILYADQAVGRLLDWLRARGDYEDALVVVTSDHGEHLGEAGRFAHQFSVEEELLRVPLLVKFPGNAGAGRIVEDPLVSNLDVYATILAAAGDRPPPGPARDLAGPWRTSLGSASLRAGCLRQPACPEAVDRRFLIAESYHALPFLRAHRERHPDFPLERHAVDRRVVFDRRGRSVYEERDGRIARVESQGEGEAARAEHLRDYLRSLGAGRMRQRAEPLDPAAREQLRALGYVD
jgi:arylsulfatase A-like enzyme